MAIPALPALTLYHHCHLAEAADQPAANGGFGTLAADSEGEEPQLERKPKKDNKKKKSKRSVSFDALDDDEVSSQIQTVFDMHTGTYPCDDTARHV